MMKGILVEIDYVHRMKRQFEKILEKRIEAIDIIEMDNSQIELKYPKKDTKSNKRFLLMQKLKMKRQQVSNKEEELKNRKAAVDLKFEEMNEMNNLMTIRSSTLEHMGSI